MGIREELSNTLQKITLYVKIGGAEITNVQGVDVTMGLSQVNAAAQIHIAGARPSIAEELASVDVWAGYNGHVAQIFYGELSGLAWEYFPGVITLDARDRLARLRLPWGGADREYTEQDDAAIVQNLVEAMGIDSSVTHIESSGWTLGVIEPVIAKSDQPFWPLVELIDKLAGFRTFTGPDGVVRRMPISGQVGAGSAFTYSKGANIIRARRTRSLDGIYNKITITGLTYEGLEVSGEAQADSPYIPTPPQYIGDSIQSNLVETDGKATEIAVRMVADRNRRPEAMELEVIGNPLLQPAMTITVEHPDLEAGSANLRIDRIQHSISRTGFRSTMTTLGGALSGVSSMPPVAQFDLKFFLEGEDTGEGVETRIVCVADGTASTDPDGDASLMTYAWEVAAEGGTPDPATGEGPVFRFVIAGDATECTVTLTVTDVQGMTGTLTRTVPIDTSMMLIEELWTAEGDVIAGSFDGEKTWVEQTLEDEEATCCAQYAAAWGQIWGTDSGHIRATFDRLETLIDLGAPHGAVAVTAVWIHEQDATRLWAGFEDGKVYFGVLNETAQTATWSLRGTVPGAGEIHEIRESYGTLGELRVTAGNAYYYSSDAGASWTTVGTGGGGAQSWRMAAGFDTNLYSFLNDSQPLRAEGGATVTLPEDTEHIRGVAMGWRVQEVYAADDQANLLRSDTDLLTLAVVGSAPAGVNHLVRSSNIDGVVYAACGDGTGDNNGAIKSIRCEAPWYIRKTGSRKVHMVGVGAAHLPNIVGDIELLRFSTPSTPEAYRGVWHFQKNIGWLNKSTGLPTDAIAWQYIAASPFNPNHWLLLGNTQYNGHFPASGGTIKMQSLAVSPLWLTTNAGASWSQVPLPAPVNDDLNQALPRGQFLFQVEWSSIVAGRWAMGGEGGDPSLAVPGGGTIWRGTLGTVVPNSYVLADGDYGGDHWSWIASGLNDEVLISGTKINAYYGPGDASIAYSSGHSADFTFGDPDISGMSFFMERMPDASPTVVATRSFEFAPGRGMQVISNYKNFLNLLYHPNALPEVGGWTVSSTREGAYLAGSMSGVWRYPATKGSGDVYTFGAPAKVPGPLDSEPTYWVRVDRQTRSLIAVALVNHAGCYVNDGAGWAYQPGPAYFEDGHASELGAIVEVINRA